MMNPDEEIVIDAREIMWGGVRVDGIPPLEFPTQLFPDEAAEWINDTDIVVGVEIDGDARAYPIRIIAWHEMVNDTIGGVPVSLAYCTLCGSRSCSTAEWGRRSIDSAPAGCSTARTS